ncbi:hypothetical protein [Lactobacillus brevis] [Lactiplantibacillus mudanjiangensis]|uniref:hypothetical protein n=1 Tax=Lactiplantibacillus mudanjiangensis TaxID=1296538 RepID=UPI0010157C9B|nr:hypothetical protein [Lactiplantibacillus mudanjiangensis]VDG33433.1 hypothetical protein [Lactobacillus brevis] [Lactiplantibacillus mudanjiangensis]
MQSTLAKSVFVGVAALSFASVAQLNANAATKTTTKSNVTLTTDATTRNVVPTGSNAIYSYPKTVKKSARTIASKATVAKLASSKSSKDYFRAYRVLTTSKGSVYYKVVSFDGSVRGYIYGGKSTSAFAGGLKAATTTTEKALTVDETTNNYYFKSVGTANVTWNAPKNTQYKASKMVVNTTPFKGDILKVTKAETKTREGSLYYYVEDATHPTINGWVYAGALTTTTPLDAATQVTVNYVDASGKTVKTANVKAADKNGKFDVNTLYSEISSSLVGSGYGFDQTDNNNNLNKAKFGDTVTVHVYTTATSKLAFWAKSSTASDAVSSADAPTTTGYTQLSKDNVTLPSLTNTQYAALTGRTGEALTTTAVKSVLAENNGALKTLIGNKLTTAKNDKGVSVKGYYKYTLASEPAKDAKFGDTYNLLYTSQFVQADKLPGTTDQGNTNYAK